MALKDETKNQYEDLTAGTDVPADGDFSLEEILTEYGGGRKRQILRDVEARVNPGPEPVFQEEPAPEREALPAKQPPEKPRGRAGKAEAPEQELPPSPHPISLEEVVGSTVDAVMEENREPLLRPRRGLFSRKPLRDTEELYAAPEPEEEPEEEEEPIGPEMPLFEAADLSRSQHQSRKGLVPGAFAMALAPVLVLGAQAYGVTVPWWSDSLRNQALALLGCLVLSALLTHQVFAEGARMLARKRCTGELLISLSAVVSALDCVSVLLLPERAAVTPYAAVSAMGLAFAQWGLARRSRGAYDMFRSAAVDDEPPYLVTETEKGACKQRGAVPGFYTAAAADDGGVLWQTALLPVVLVASFVFAGLSSLGQGRDSDFLLNWSAILAAGATFSLPLCWSLPWSRLARHLQKAGSAVAGWRGAERIAGRRCMIVTDSDLFPPGTI